MSTNEYQRSPTLLVLIGAIVTGLIAWVIWKAPWDEREAPPEAPEVPKQDETMTLRENVSVLAPTPDWTELDAYQNTITRETFARVLADVYSEGPAFKTSINIGEDQAIIRATEQPYVLKFASSPTSKVPKRYWRAAAQLPIAEAEAQARPLDGLKIAIDPGHIGGKWAKMEERWYQIDGKGTEVKEGELTLKVARLLKPKLESLGAKVSLVRDRRS